jgi:phospholipid/cholesterol/gamma-HCH transport system permease protein
VTAKAGQATVVGQDAEARLCVSGDWILAHYDALSERVAALRRIGSLPFVVEADALGRLDTAGASLLCTLLEEHDLTKTHLFAAMPTEQQALLQMVRDALTCSSEPPARRRGWWQDVADVLEHIGRTMVLVWRHFIDLAGFIGLTLEATSRVLLRPSRWRLTALMAHLEKTAFDAVPIVALLTFLVGAVVAFLGATVLAEFGASIYTVDLVAYSFLREFGVLLTAIIVAGRTASAFTAQIGSMRANEEIDALRVLGLDPVELLVLPRVLALLLALPMLSFVAMLAGMTGGLLVCAVSLDVSPTMFLSILENNVAVRHFLVGLIKAPIFAFLIGVIGCLEGFKVAGSAESVGEHTTSAVVQSIFIVILVDAVAAMICMEMSW